MRRLIGACAAPFCLWLATGHSAAAEQPRSFPQLNVAVTVQSADGAQTHSVARCAIGTPCESNIVVLIDGSRLTYHWQAVCVAGYVHFAFVPEAGQPRIFPNPQDPGLIPTGYASEGSRRFPIQFSTAPQPSVINDLVVHRTEPPIGSVQVALSGSD